MSGKENEKMWVGMPEFIQEDKSAIKRVTVNFETVDDLNLFNEVTGLSVTMKTKGVFFPKKPKVSVEYVSGENND